MAYEAKEARLRPPGQMSLSDLYSDTPTLTRPAVPVPVSPAATPVSTAPTMPTHADATRTQSINQLVAHLSSATSNVVGKDSLDLSGLHSIREEHRSPQHVMPMPTGDDGSLPVSQKSPRASIAADLAGLESAAHHDAIVRHFQLRRVVEDDGSQQHHNHHHHHRHHFTEDEELELEGEDDPSAEATPTAQRMINAAKIHEFRRKQSRRGSGTVSMVHMIPVSKRRLLRWQRRATRRIKGMLEDIVTPFSPIGTFSKLRGLVLLIMMVIQVFVVPFGPIYFPHGSRALDVLNGIFDVCYIVDFLASCNTAYFDKPDQLEFSRRKIILRYVKSGWPFWIDLLTSVPIDTILGHELRRREPALAHVDMSGYLLLAELHSLVRFFSWAAFLKSIWFMRVVRATKEFWFRLVYSRLSYALSVAKVVLLLLVVTHYIACFWRLSLLPTVTDTSHPWTLYLSDLYYAAQLLQGQAGPADTVGQSVFGVLAMLFGCLAIAVITSGVALILINYSSNTSLFQRKLESVFATMDKMQLPPQLRRRIHQYYNHLWFEHDAIDGDIAKFSHELSRSLGLEVRLYKYMKLVLSVPYWRNSSADFVTQIMLSLDVRAYLPEDYIVRQGEIGDGLFLINRGVCELTSCPAEQRNSDSVPSLARNTVKTASGTSADAGVNVRHLMAGHSFGELALLMNYRRTADVRAASYVEICVLERTCFQRLLIRYREDRRDVLRELMLSCIEKSAMRFIAFPWEDMVDRMLRLSKAKQTSHTQLSPWEAAELIVDYICPQDVTDDTVTFGFQDFDALSSYQLEPLKVARGSSDACACHARHRETIDRLATLEKTVEALVAELRTLNKRH